MTRRLTGPGVAALFAALVAVTLIGDSLAIGRAPGASPTGTTGPDAAAVASPIPGPTASAVPAGPPISSPIPVATAAPTEAPSQPSGPNPGRPATGDPEDCEPVPPGIERAPLVRSIDTDARVVALTFDDGWDAEDVEAVFDILERERVNATFFPTGWAVAFEPDLWRRIAAAGFPIGNHTMNHSDLTSLCFDRQVNQLQRANRTMRRVLGIEPLPVLRPPYGKLDRSARLAASAAGLAAIVKWNIDPHDWSGMSGAGLAQLAIDGPPGSIVVLHTLDNTVRALPAIIAGYRARGFTFVTVGQLLGIDAPVPFD